MDIETSRKLAKFLISKRGLGLSLDTRMKIIKIAEKTNKESELPKKIKDLL